MTVCFEDTVIAYAGEVTRKQGCEAREESGQTGEFTMQSPSPPGPEDVAMRHSTNVTLAFVFLPLFGGLAGFFGYIVSALVLEQFFMPTGPAVKLSYGATAALITLPICTVLGAATGFAIAFVWVHRWWVCSILLLLIALLGMAIVLPMWNQQLARYGRDPSEMILFYPPLMLCGLAIVASTSVAALGVIRGPASATEKASAASMLSVTRVKGTAPAMTSDLEEVIRRVQDRLPDIQWAQISVTHAADDDGLWFFWLPRLPGEVQIESDSGACPFLIETDKHDGRLVAESAEDTADTIVRWLELPGGRTESVWHAR